MSGLYVASNVSSIGSAINLQRSNTALDGVLRRLSTGLRINSGKDDPAGLIASELLKSDIAASQQAVKNTQRANSLVAVADSALDQVGTLLNDIRTLVNEGANDGAMSEDQIAANQLQIDASIDSIDRISKTTVFQGKKLLDGSFEFTTSGIDASKLQEVEIQAANFDESMNVKVKVLEEAKKGTFFCYGTGTGSDTVMEVGGSEGSEVFKFAAGTSNAEMAAAINKVTDATGVEARVEGVAQRGTITLSNAGSNNDIVITANDVGMKNGNYSFRIVQGASNDVRVVSEPDSASQGIVEISLVPAYEGKFDNFAGMFNITTTTDKSGQPASVTMTRGTANTARYTETASAASGTTAKSGTMSALAANVTAAGLRMSQLNGWSVVIDNTQSTIGIIDQDAKSIHIALAGTAAQTTQNISSALTQALGTTGGANDVLSFTGTALANGDHFTFANGGDAGELFVTYKEGATLGEIQDLINNTPHSNATLLSGASRDDLVKNIPDDRTHMSTASVTETSRYSSGATAAEVIAMINGKLGDKFLATTLNKEAANGYVSFQNASVISGDFEHDNALRFTGMDSGPIIRMVNVESDGKPIANQALSVSIVQPNDADIANGVRNPILQINLATDASGQVTSTAKDIAALFDRLSPAETLGVSAELIAPPGTDPNGRVWVTDDCGKTTVKQNCGTDFGNGIVQPTGVPGPCEIKQNDMIMLGENQSIVEDRAVARISGNTNIVTTLPNAIAYPVSGNINELAIVFNNGSGINGISFGFTFDETQEGFDETTGTLISYIDQKTHALAPDGTDGGFVPGTAQIDAAIKSVIDSAISENWEAIRSYNGATGPAPTVKAFSVTGVFFGIRAIDSAIKGIDTLTKVPATTSPAIPPGDHQENRGVVANDPVMFIKALKPGTDMAGIGVFFEQDNSMNAYVSGNMELSVDISTLSDGSRALIVKGNAAGNPISADILASSLNANAEFNSAFRADAAYENIWTTTNVMPLGTVTFSTDQTRELGVTSGGYRIDSAATRSGSGIGTSSGISMLGQSDSNERLVLSATESGSNHFVSVNVVEGALLTFCPKGKQLDHLAGTDAVITVNGQKAAASGDDFSVSGWMLQMSGSVTSELKAGESTNFLIDGGGGVFQLGPNVVSSQQYRFAIQSVDSTNLGGKSGKLYQLKSGENASLKSDTKLADKIVQEAISAIANTRAQLGALQKCTLEPNISVIEDTIEQLSAAEALISNADFAVESSNLARMQVLVQSGAKALGLANQQPQYAATLI